MGEIIRSRTYEAFFPLIVIAVFYYLLAAFLIWIVGRIEVRVDPRARSKRDAVRKEK